MDESNLKGQVAASTDLNGMIGISRRFALLNKLITRDLNNNTS